MTPSALYASALTLDRKDIQALKITDAYSIHRVVYSLFEDVRSEDEKRRSMPSGIVYADKGGDRMGRQIIILSDRPPLENATYKGDFFGEVRVKPLPEGFLSHSRYNFSVVINPSRRDSKTKKRLPIKGGDAITTWFSERSEKNWGFRVVPTTLEYGGVNVEQFEGKDSHLITIPRASLKGVMEITDPELFKRSFAKGIGRSRAFGCGLLQVVPVLDSPFI